MKSILLGMLAGVAIAMTPAAIAGDGAQAENTAGDENTAFLIIRFNVDEARLPEFLDIMTNINTLMASEEGFVSAMVYRGKDDPLSFTLIEAWRTRDLHREHYDRIVENGDWANILDMLTAEPDMSYNDLL